MTRHKQSLPKTAQPAAQQCAAADATAAFASTGSGGLLGVSRVSYAVGPLGDGLTCCRTIIIDNKMNANNLATNSLSDTERLGSKSLRYSVIGTAISLVEAALILIDWMVPLKWHWQEIISDGIGVIILVLPLVSVYFYVNGLWLGIKDRRSWRGIVGLALAVISPGWLWIYFAAFCIGAAMS